MAAGVNMNTSAAQLTVIGVYLLLTRRSCIIRVGGGGIEMAVCT